MDKCRVTWCGQNVCTDFDTLYVEMRDLRVELSPKAAWLPMVVCTEHAREVLDGWRFSYA